jgi:ribose-phosphate pyrophosphokinase
LKDPSAPPSASWSRPVKSGLRLGDSRRLDQFVAEMEMKVFCGTANRALGEEVAAELGFPLGRVTIRRFEDGEIYARFEESVRGVDAFIIQPTCPPVNENLMELLVMVDALSRASAARITAVMPYYGYARQDKKHAPRAPITGRLVADLLQAAGIHECSRSISMPIRSRASSRSPSTTSGRCRCSPNTWGARTSPMRLSWPRTTVP